MSEFVDQWADAMPSIPKEAHDVAAQKAVERGWDRSGPRGAMADMEMFPLPKMSPAQAAGLVANILTASDRGVDMVNLPEHYARYAIEPIRFICENKLDFFQGNVVKYIVRHDAKNGIEDIRKVIRYATMYVRFLEGDPDWWRAGKPEDLVGAGPMVGPLHRQRS